MIEISVIIPTFGRPDALRRCLRALALSDFPNDQFEVVVVDDGSPRPLGSELAQFKNELNLVVIRQENAGAAAARNSGARQARGRYLAFTDDDCLPAPGWIRNLQAHLEAAPEAALGGLTNNAAPDNVYSSVRHLLAHHVYDTYVTDPSSVRFFGSNNFALAREPYEREGGFNEQFRPAYEDRDLCDRLIRRGVRFIYAPQAMVAHDRRMDLRSFLRQHAGYGRGAFIFYRRTERAGDGRRMFFLWRVMWAATTGARGWHRLVGPILVMLSQLAALFGFILSAGKGRGQRFVFAFCNRLGFRVG